MIRLTRKHISAKLIYSQVKLQKPTRDISNKSAKRYGAVEKVFVKGFKFLKLSIYLIYLTYDLLSLSWGHLRIRNVKPGKLIKSLKR